MSHLLLRWKITISPTHILMLYFLDEWLQVWTRGFIKDSVINGTLINTNSITADQVTEQRRG